MNNSEFEREETTKNTAVRIDLPWSTNTESELQNIQKSCYQLANDHHKGMKRTKLRYTIFGLPSMLIPLVIGGTGSYIDERYDWVRSTALIVTAINSGILQFFNFGQKSSNHNETSGKYSELGDLIKLELAKPEKFRVSCDVFMERIFVKYQNINSTAPVL